MSITMKGKRIFSLLMALVMLVGAFSVVSISAAETETKTANVDTITDGVYRIKNSSTGKYIDTYDFNYDSLGRAYLDYATGMNGQDFYVERQDDGTYVFFALTEKEPYVLGLTEGDALRKEKEITANAKFDLEKLENGRYTVTAIYKNGPESVLSVSDKRSDYWHSFVTLAKDDGSEAQQWEFIKVVPTSFTLSSSSVRVQPYSIGSLTARVYPTYITDKVEWKSSDESVIMVDSDGSYCALKEGTATITATCAGKSATCKVTVSGITAFSWFSQHNMYSGGWNALALKDVYFYAGGRYKPFMVDKYNNNYDWMDEGCLVCCIAMLLRNMGATLDGAYDIRSGKTGGLEADPYTVSLANAASSGATADTKTIYGNPIYVCSSRIADSFKVKGKSFTVETTYYVTKQAIKNALDEHPEGVIVGFKKWDGSHYLLFTKCVNPEETDSNNYQFIVCDPASYNGTDGDHVLFENSYSYRTIGYRYYNAVSIEEWSLVK